MMSSHRSAGKLCASRLRGRYLRRVTTRDPIVPEVELREPADAGGRSSSSWRILSACSVRSGISPNRSTAHEFDTTASDMPPRSCPEAPAQGPATLRGAVAPAHRDETVRLLHLGAGQL